MKSIREQIELCRKLLKKEKRYIPAILVEKLERIGFKASESTFSRIKSGKKVSEDTLERILEGLSMLIEKELGVSLKQGVFIDIKEEGWKAEIVDSKKRGQGFVFHDAGRLNQADKVDFFSRAKTEVIEFGLTLNTFSNYFENRSDAEFKNPIRTLLEKGVNFKCYLIDPDSIQAHHYFEDRKQVIPKEKNITEKIKEEIIPRLRDVQTEFSNEGYLGKFEVLKYKHIPNNYFLVVDGEGKTGTMTVSHYLYGIKRAKCPVLEINKSDNRDLFRRYWNSLNYLIKNAKPI